MTEKQMREIDALVAEHVMGLSKLTDVEFNLGQGWYSKEDPGQEWQPSDKGPRYGVLPHYTGDPAATNDVLIEMEKKGFWYRVQGPFEPGLNHHAGFTEHNFTGWNGRPDNQCGADTKEIAICLAALTAVGKCPEGLAKSDLEVKIT